MPVNIKFPTTPCHRFIGYYYRFHSPAVPLLPTTSYLLPATREPVLIHALRHRGLTSLWTVKPQS